MLCITEAIVTKKDVYGNLGSYYGGYGGALAGGTGGAILTGGNPFGVIWGALLGGGIGSNLGKSTALAGLEKPNSAVDFNNAAERIGYLAKPYNNPSQKAALGNLAGVATYFGSRLTDHALPFPALVFGLGGLGSKLHNAISDDGAKKIGYGIPGRAAAFAFGPSAGLISPWEVPDKKTSKKKK